MNVKHVLSASLTLAAISMPVTADVFVVTNAGGGDFTAIQPAIDAASDGDTVYVKWTGANYASFVVDGKALTIVGEEFPPYMSFVTGSVRIENIPAGKTLTLASVGFVEDETDVPSLRVTSCAGAVRIVRSYFRGEGHLISGARVENSPNVAFQGCTILGSGATCQLGGTVGGGGLEVSASNVALYDSTLFGGAGPFHQPVSHPGGPALLALPGSITFASDTKFQGGFGGRGECGNTYSISGDGGPGIHLNGPISVQLLDSQLLGGLPGYVWPGDERTAGNVGPLLTSTDATQPFSYVVSHLAMRVPSLAREGEFIQIEFVGDPGDQIFLNDALTTSNTFDLVPSYRGVVIAPFPSASTGPVRERRWGVIPASGHLKQVYRAPQLPAGVEAETRFLQAYRKRANGITLGSFATLTVLDSSF